MKNIFLLAIIVVLSTSLGCGNFNPRMNPKIDNQNGTIDELRNNQNGVMAEIGKLKQNAELQNSQLKDVQNGLLNLNNSLSKNENSGIQILQGDGALIMVFSLCVIALLLWYRDRAVKNEKAASIMAKEIAKINDPNLNDNVLRAALLSHSESHVYKMLVKERRNLS